MITAHNFQTYKHSYFSYMAFMFFEQNKNCFVFTKMAPINLYPSYLEN